MKKKVLLPLFSVAVLLSSQVFASESDLRTGDIRDIEKFFYNQGVRDSYNEAYIDGYSKAVKDALMALKRYKLLIRAREAGKYLSEEKKVTSPEIYSLKTSNGLQVIVRGCKIEKELTAEDILRAPIVNAKILSDGKFEPYEKSKVKEKQDRFAQNSVSIIEKDKASSEVPMLPGNETARDKRIYLNSSTMRQALDRNNIVYSVSDKNIIAIFSSKRSAEKFEKEYHLN